MVGPGDTHRKWVLLHGDFFKRGGMRPLRVVNPKLAGAERVNKRDGGIFLKTSGKHLYRGVEFAILYIASARNVL